MMSNNNKNKFSENKLLLIKLSLVAAVSVIVIIFFRQPGTGPDTGSFRNVILISIDTLRADMLGSYGNTDSLTPNIDALASRSAVFSNTVSVSPWTIPTHFSIFTGLNPSKHKMNRTYYQDTYDKLPPLSKAIPTLGELLSKKGYRCVAFTGGGFMNSMFGYGRGFELYDNDCYQIDEAIPKFLSWLENNRSDRFFAFIHTYSCHFPYERARQVKIHSNDRLIDIFDKTEEEYSNTTVMTRFTEDKLTAALAMYKDSIYYIDMHLGIMLAHLENNDMMDDTMIIITSDHGEEFYDHGAFKHGDTMYAEQLNVPLIVYAPSLFKSGTAVNTIASVVDIFPTLTESLGYNIASDGISLVELYKGYSDREFIFSEASFYELKALTSIRRKFIYNSQARKNPYIRSDNNLEFQLYNTAEDSDELTNIALIEPDTIHSIKARLDTITDMNSSYDLDRDKNSVMRYFRDKIRSILKKKKDTTENSLDRESEIRKLKALGYAQ